MCTSDAHQGVCALLLYMQQQPVCASEVHIHCHSCQSISLHLAGAVATNSNLGWTPGGVPSILQERPAAAMVQSPWHPCDSILPAGIPGQCVHPGYNCGQGWPQFRSGQFMPFTDPANLATMSCEELSAWYIPELLEVYMSNQCNESRARLSPLDKSKPGLSAPVNASCLMLLSVCRMTAHLCGHNVSSDTGQHRTHGMALDANLCSTE